MEFKSKSDRALAIGMKICQKCSVDKTLSMYSKNAKSKHGHSTRCKECDNAARKKYYAENCAGRQKIYDNAREHKLQAKYGISQSDYLRIAAAQNDSCAICNITQKEYSEKDGSKNGHDKRPKWLAIDHDHDTGVIRGVLCNECNRAIGLLGDTAESLKKAYAYLVDFESKAATRSNND